MIIRDKDKQNIINLAKKSIKKPAKICAYGSRVNGDAHDTSDLDLVIIANQELSINEFVTFQEKLQTSNIPILVQVVDWYKIPVSFQKNISGNYEEIVRINDE